MRPSNVVASHARTYVVQKTNENSNVRLLYPISGYLSITQHVVNLCRKNKVVDGEAADSVRPQHNVHLVVKN